MTDDQNNKMKIRKSWVRIIITYIASGFLFGVPILLIIYQLYKGQFEEANKLFMTILPTATTIVGYWFAKREAEKNQ